MVVRANHDLKNKTQSLRNIEKFIMRYHLPQNLKSGVNLSQQLHVLQGNIRNTQVKLNSLVSGGKDI